MTSRRPRGGLGKIVSSVVLGGAVSFGVNGCASNNIGSLNVAEGFEGIADYHFVSEENEEISNEWVYEGRAYVKGELLEEISMNK